MQLLQLLCSGSRLGCCCKGFAAGLMSHKRLLTNIRAIESDIKGGGPVVGKVYNDSAVSAYYCRSHIVVVTLLINIHQSCHPDFSLSIFN